MAGGASGERGFIETKTYSLGVLFLSFVILSISFEYVIHQIKHYFHKHKKHAMVKAIDNFLSELMLLGLFSLVLSVFQEDISHIQWRGDSAMNEWYILSDAVASCDTCLKTTMHVQPIVLEECKATWGEYDDVYGAQKGGAKEPYPDDKHTHDDEHTYENGHRRMLRNVIESEALLHDVSVNVAFLAGLEEQLGDFLLETEAAEVAGLPFPAHEWSRKLSAAAAEAGEEEDKGKYSILTITTLHQVHIYVFLIAASHIINTILGASLAWWVVNYQWKRFSDEKDRRFVGLIELLHVYNVHYMAQLTKRSPLLAKSESTESVGSGTTNGSGNTMDDLVNEFNTAAQDGFCTEQTQCQPHLCKLKNKYGVSSTELNQVTEGHVEGSAVELKPGDVEAGGQPPGGPVGEGVVAGKKPQGGPVGEGVDGAQQAAGDEGHRFADDEQQEGTGYQLFSFQDRKLLTLPSRMTDRGPQSTADDSRTSLADSKPGIRLWTGTFFKQLVTAVTREEWHVARCSFFLTHRLQEDFNFHHYLIECFEEEVAVLTSMSMAMWLCIVLVIFLGGHAGWLTPVLEFAALLVLFIANTKAKLAIRQAVGDGIVRRLTSNVFWFGKPQYLAAMLRFVCYSTSFVFADMVFWAWQFGRKSCFFSSDILRNPHMPWWLSLAINVGIVLHLGLIAMPTYSLATQLGSTYKKHLITTKVQSSLLKNLRDIRMRRRRQRRASMAMNVQNAGSRVLRAAVNLPHVGSHGDVRRQNSGQVASENKTNSG